MLKNRLSALDASFLSMEDDDSNMCVGGADVFAGPAPGQDEVLEELGRRLEAVPTSACGVSGYRWGRAGPGGPTPRTSGSRTTSHA